MGSRRARLLAGLRGTVSRLAAERRTSAPPLEEEEEEVEEMSEEEAVERLLRRQQKATWKRRIQKMMEPPSPPERTLTRQAMDQIRYLRQEFPAEWPVSRLAQGFQVSPEVVVRVLQSRFVPSPEYAKKQDARVRGCHSVKTLPSPRSHSVALLASPSSSTTALSQPSTPLPALFVKNPEEVQGQRVPSSQEEEDTEPETPLSLEEVEELAAQGWHQHNPAWVPMQKGWEFFDPHGNLVFKVPEGLSEAGKDKK